ncbi:tetratricopeptide repeat protein [Spartinivicinus ruber]|uniref:tetratricopeptide repeat protein n=1 Tax=Spartinivicinus ruber TaxID=2683272 RepID=UPI0013D2CCEE|nr:tetratricopeptide repeat protein [Spartinivicinus ruber]
MLKLSTIAFTAMFSWAVQGAQLPAEIEVDRYILAAEKHINNEEFRQAEDYLQRAVALQVSTPDKFYFLYGQVLLRNGKLSQAQENLERYLKKAGKEGEFYQQALALYTEAEEKLAIKTKASQPTSKIPVDAIKAGPSKSEKLVTSLKKLYLTDNDEEALLRHINAILNNYAVRTGKIINLNKEADLVYSVTANKQGELFVTRRSSLAADANKRFSSSKLSVYGVDPFVDYQCSQVEKVCWLKHPVDGQRWLVIRKDNQAIKDLAQTMTALLRTKQK